MTTSMIPLLLPLLLMLLLMLLLLLLLLLLMMMMMMMMKTTTMPTMLHLLLLMLYDDLSQVMLHDGNGETGYRARALNLVHNRNVIAEAWTEGVLHSMA
jgi:hypothetical protein